MAIVSTKPQYKFICDRCGKEEYIEGSQAKYERYVYFDEWVVPSVMRAVKKGNVCKKCHNDFIDLANRFFHEVNKEAEE